MEESKTTFDRQVCAALGTVPGVMLDEGIIALPIYKAAAWRDIAKHLDNPKQVQLDEEKGQVLERAWIYATALRLLPYYKQQVMKVEQSTAAKVERFSPNWEGLEGTLRAGLDEALVELVPELAGEGSGHIGFRLTTQGGGAGRCTPS